MSKMLKACALIGMFAANASAALAASPAADDPWPGLVTDVFKGRPLEDGKGILTIEMPYRAEDAAIVPLTVRTTLLAGDERRPKTFTVIIDRNPAPLVGTFEVGANAGLTSISTRVRVDTYTNVHAVAELSDGKLYVVDAFVKASGGCSAPAAKNPDEAKATAGQMRFRQFAKASSTGDLREAQIMIRHPNHSGLQMDQLTRLYVPAYFVRELRVWQGDELVLSMDGGISISEDPNIRFDYRPNGAATFRVEAVDTDNRVFKGEWPVEASAM